MTQPNASLQASRAFGRSDSAGRIGKAAAAVWLVILLGVLPGCGGREPAPRRSVRESGSRDGADRVLLVYNVADSVSRRVALYYQERRSVPERHLLPVRVSPAGEINLSVYRDQIEAPVRRFLGSLARGDSIDYIVLAKGLPLRIRDGGWSVDACLGAMDLGRPLVARRDAARLASLANPYFRRREHFHHGRFAFYLVTRLDGYTASDAMALVDRSLRSQGSRGPFLLDLDPRRERGGYGLINQAMRRAAEILHARGFEVRVDETVGFAGSERPLAGYYSWGSNDGGFSRAVYLSMRFNPGAIAETAVSTSARTFSRVEGGQSLIADLIAGGVTGVKGYVSEPFSSALCQADILFDRYTAGFNLAESFYMATPFVQWKDVVVGDPICAPYAAPAGGVAMTADSSDGSRIPSPPWHGGGK